MAVKLMARKAPDPWSIKEAAYPAAGTTAEKLRFLVGYAVLAPSARNSQPWRFDVKVDKVSVYADFSRRLPVADPSLRQLYESLGCALENLLIAARRFGFACRVIYFPMSEEDELVAQVFCTAAGPSRASRLFRSIPLRRTHHGNYDGRPLAHVVVEKLMGCCTEQGLSLMFAQEPRVKEAVAKMLMRADALSFANAAYRQELADSIGSGSFGGSWLLSQVGQFAMAHLDMEKSVKKRDHKSLVHSPAFGLISGEKGSRTFQVKAGQLLERLYLTAHQLGLCMQPVSILLETEEVSAAFAKMFRAGGVPLLPFRIGYAEAPAHPTPRRPLLEVLL
jgi:nitroreductase